MFAKFHQPKPYRRHRVMLLSSAAVVTEPAEPQGDGEGGVEHFIDRLADKYSDLTPKRPCHVGTSKSGLRQLVASRDVGAGEVIACYPVLDSDHPSEYSIAIIDPRSDRGYRIGFPSTELLQRMMEDPPLCPVPPIAMFANEPGPDERENVRMEFPRVDNPSGYFDGQPVYVATLKSIRQIKSGSPIVWCYGDEFERGYKTSCTEPDEQSETSCTDSSEYETSCTDSDDE